MTAEDMIIDYLNRLSRGIININKKQANQIVNMVRKYESEEIEVQRFDWRMDTYVEGYRKMMLKSEVEPIVNKMRNAKQFEKFFRYVIPELSFDFYSVNPNLF